MTPDAARHPSAARACANAPSILENKTTPQQFDTPNDSAVAWDCDCSICAMRRNVHVIVPKEDFRLKAGAGAFVSEYKFGTKTAVHQFCSRCGVCAFYRPRSNPDGVAVTLWCVRPGTLRSVEVRRFGGSDWERAYEETKIAEQTAAK